MNRHALDVLQYNEALSVIAGFASGPLGAEAVRALEPTDAIAWIDPELDRVAQMMGFIQRSPDFGMPAIPDCRVPLRRLATPGSVLEPIAFRDLANLMRSARLMAETFRRTVDAPAIAEVASRLAHLDAEESRVRHVIDDKGDVRDGASRELAGIRREMRGARSRVVQKLEQYMATLPARTQVADASVTLREGRYVIPIRKEGRGDVGGLVHDESATGQTLFVEPPIAIELMNRLRELEIAEVREVQRILRELTDSLRPQRDALEQSLDALIRLDSIWARARFALRHDGHRPILGRDDAPYAIVNARHPLLLATAAEVVPFDLTMEPHERTLLVSGPNTGGKTVLLKAVGLLSALAQAGIIPTVGEGTRLPVFLNIFADIGDEQSIEASLSTFSAHLRNLHEIVEAADASSLVLVDEMGSGTDPIEGAALARSILVELTGRGALTVATTHLGELKQLAAEESRVVNASLDFDAVELRPTYRLRKGVPGRSYGLAIARRLGFPGYVLERADAAVPEAERRLGSLLEEVETKERALADALNEAESARAIANRMMAELHEREASLEARERSAERRARQQAKELLLAARSEVESAIRELKESAASANPAGLDDSIRRARRRVEDSAQAQGRRATIRRPAREHATIEQESLNEGDHVRIETTGAQGRVIELRDERAVVDIGGVRMRVAAADLVVVPEPTPAPAQRTSRGTWAVADFDAASEVDLRGMRADEAVSRLQPALDAAIQAALPSLRIIHGKGTGALREVVADVLRSDSRIRAYRAGGIGEGGTGVTVVELA
jgi:DNA mismatch repair protein MutS2